jgi:hypothetical protein
MPDWTPDLLVVLLSLAFGGYIGHSLARWQCARDLARLRSLVPGVWTLRTAASACYRSTLVSTARELDALAARIEAAEGGEGESNE